MKDYVRRRALTAVSVTCIGTALAVAALLVTGNGPAGTGDGSSQNTPSSSPGKKVAVIIGAGDIAACGQKRDRATARLLSRFRGTVFTTGDNVYEDGSLRQYRRCYGPTWGRFRARTRPAPGNHDYHTPGARGYFRYFGRAAGKPGRGYYSYDRGRWHLISLDSNCGPTGGCGPASRQYSWLVRDLRRNRNPCAAAYMHHPRWTSGNAHPDTKAVGPLVRVLYRAGVEVLIAGHNHQYERFAPQTPRRTLNHRFGIREFVVGTGGAERYGFGRPDRLSRVRYNATPGVLRLWLRPHTYSWRFHPTSGSFHDHGRGRCHGRPGG